MSVIISQDSNTTHIIANKNIIVLPQQTRSNVIVWTTDDKDFSIILSDKTWTNKNTNNTVIVVDSSINSINLCVLNEDAIKDFESTSIVDGRYCSNPFESRKSKSDKKMVKLAKTKIIPIPRDMSIKDYSSDPSNIDTVIDIGELNNWERYSVSKCTLKHQLRFVIHKLYGFNTCIADQPNLNMVIVSSVPNMNHVINDNYNYIDCYGIENNMDATKGIIAVTDPMTYVNLNMNQLAITSVQDKLVLRNCNIGTLVVMGISGSIELKNCRVDYLILAKEGIHSLKYDYEYGFSCRSSDLKSLVRLTNCQVHELTANELNVHINECKLDHLILNESSIHVSSINYYSRSNDSKFVLKSFVYRSYNKTSYSNEQEEIAYIGVEFPSPTNIANTPLCGSLLRFLNSNDESFNNRNSSDNKYKFSKSNLILVRQLEFELNNYDSSSQYLPFDLTNAESIILNCKFIPICPTLPVNTKYLYFKLNNTKYYGLTQFNLSGINVSNIHLDFRGANIKRINLSNHYKYSANSYLDFSDSKLKNIVIRDPTCPKRKLFDKEITELGILKDKRFNFANTNVSMYFFGDYDTYTNFILNKCIEGKDIELLELTDDNFQDSYVNLTGQITQLLIKKNSLTSIDITNTVFDRCVISSGNVDMLVCKQDARIELNTDYPKILHISNGTIIQSADTTHLVEELAISGPTNLSHCEVEELLIDITRFVNLKKLNLSNLRIDELNLTKFSNLEQIQINGCCILLFVVDCAKPVDIREEGCFICKIDLINELKRLAYFGSDEKEMTTIDEPRYTSSYCNESKKGSKYEQFITGKLDKYVSRQPFCSYSNPEKNSDDELDKDSDYEEQENRCNAYNNTYDSDSDNDSDY